MLQDLSAARYSGHVETHETVTESRSYSSSSSAPRPPERSVKTSLTSPGPRLSNGDTLHRYIGRVLTSLVACQKQFLVLSIVISVKGE